MAENIRVIKLVSSRNDSASKANPNPHQPPHESQSSKPGPSSPKFSPSSNKKLILTVFLGAVFALICFASYRWFIFSATHLSTNNSYIETEVWPVNSRNLGYVKMIRVQENEHVKKGQLLAELDDSDVQIELVYKKAKYEKTLADVERARILHKSKLVSAADMETADATLTAMKADLDGSLLKKSFTSIVAAADGVIAKVSIHPGQFIQPGQSLMLLVVDGDIWVKANYKETELRKVKTGMEVEIEVDAYPGEIFKGEVASIYPTSGANLSLIPPENATGNFTKIVQRIPVKIKLKPKPGFELRAGMSTLSTIIVR